MRIEFSAAKNFPVVALRAHTYRNITSLYRRIIQGDFFPVSSISALPSSIT